MSVMKSCLSGKAGLSCSMRVNPDYQHQGISQKLDDYKKKHYFSSHPAMSYMLYCALGRSMV